jgi:hypothetical protein
MRYFLLILITTLLAPIQAQTIPNYIPTDGLVAWYPFSGNANDESGNGNNGIVNGATLTSDENESENNAYSFDGSDDFIDIPFDFEDGATFESTSFWFRINPSEINGVKTLWNKDGSWKEATIRILENKSIDLTWAFNNKYYGIRSNPNVIQVNTWNDILIINKKNNIKLFVNGKDVLDVDNSSEQTDLSFSSAGSCGTQYGINRIGFKKHSCSPREYYSGKISEIAFWQRGLAEEEINNIVAQYNKPEIPSYIPTDSLVAWYPFNGYANDESGNGNNGTVNGATLTTDRFGNSNSAYEFFGNEFIDINNMFDFEERTTNIWILCNDLNWGSITRLALDNDNINMTHGLVQFGIAQGVPDSIDMNQGNQSKKHQANTGEWNMFTMVRDFDSVKYYFNGHKFGAKLNGNAVSVINYIPTRIGGRVDNTSFWLGKIDDIGIWNRALTEEEILAVYNQQEENTSAPSKLSSRSLQVDSSYTKRGFKFSNYVSLDTLAASDSLISYQFDLNIPDGITYDSLRVFHTESTPSVTTNYVDGTLSVVTTGSGFITTYDPMLELFYTSDTTGTYSLTPSNVILNTTNITNINSGVMKIDPFMKGDVDDSGVIQAYDASIILHQSVGSEILQPDSVKDWEVGPWFNWRDAAADVDEDGDILALDASYISQFVAGLITEFPTSTPQVESVTIEVTDRGLKVKAPENIQSLNIELPATEQIEFRDPEMSWNNSAVVMNKAEGMKVAVASSDQVSGEVMEIPLYVYTNDNITLEVTTVTNNTKKVHQVVVSGLTVNNEVTTDLPQQYTLSQNYPNPFNPSTQIQYAVPEATQVTLEVFNSLGQKVMDLVDGQKSAGYHTATFDASGLSSGVYLYKLTTPSFSQTNKMLLIK